MPNEYWADYAAELLALSAPAQDVADPWHMEMARGFIAQLDEALGNGYASVLDVGCGTGAVADEFIRRGKRYVGLTANLADLAECQARGIECVWAEMSALPFADDAFDVIYCRHALEHALALPITLLEFRRVAPVAAVVVPAYPWWSTHPGHFYTMDKVAWAHLFRQCKWAPQALWCPDDREYRWILRRGDGAGERHRVDV